MAATAEKWMFGPNFRKLLAKDPGVLGRMARTKFIDETPMSKRETGVTNSIDGKGGAMTRRDFLWHSFIATTATACARYLPKPVGESGTVVASPEATPKFQELGIILSEVRILDETEAAVEGVTAGVTTDLTFKLMESEFRNSVKHPNIDVSKASVEKFAILVPTRTMEGQINYIYPFVAFASPPEGDSFVAMGINVAVEGGMDLRAVTLVPEDIDFKGHKVAALVIRKSPLDGSDLINPIPVFILPVDLQTWRGMSPDQQSRESMIFVPYGLQDSQDIQLPAGKLAKLVNYSPDVTPTSTPTATATNTEAPTPTPTPTEVPPTPRPTSRPTKEAAAPTPTALATEIPVVPNAGWEPDNDGSGGFHKNVLDADPCPEVAFSVELIPTDPNGPYANQINHTRYVCFRDADGKTIVLKRVLGYVSATPTP